MITIRFYFIGSVRGKMFRISHFGGLQIHTLYQLSGQNLAHCFSRINKILISTATAGHTRSCLWNGGKIIQRLPCDLWHQACSYKLCWSIVSNLKNKETAILWLYYSRDIAQVAWAQYSSRECQSRERRCRKKWLLQRPLSFEMWRRCKFLVFRELTPPQLRVVNPLL